MLSGCSTMAQTQSQSCRASLQLNWADIGVINQDIRQLTSHEFQGRKTATQGAFLSQEYLTQRFKQIGLSPWQGQYRHGFGYQYQLRQQQGVNLVGIIPAKKANAPWRLVIAHYDHLGQKGSRFFPGADDNASGVAALLQVAEHALAQTHQHPINANLMFVATDAEEPGLFGSIALVEQLTRAIDKRQIELVLNLDMVGHPSRRYSLYVEGSRNFKHYDRFAPEISKDNRLCIRKGHPRPMGTSAIKTDWLKASDHYPFHQAGIPWLYFGVPMHSHYHETTDTLARLDIRFLAGVTESSFKVLLLPSNWLGK